MLGGRDSHRTLGLDVLREIDLAGNPLRETNIDAVNAQLKARGQEIIYGFHHEFSRLPSGDIVTLGWTQRTIDVGGTPTRYAGDMLLVLDDDLQVVWTWDAFDHLDVTRGPILGELCRARPVPPHRRSRLAPRERGQLVAGGWEPPDLRPSPGLGDQDRLMRTAPVTVT